MDVVTLARWQFGITTVYHWFFVPLTLGLGWLVAAMQTRWFVTRDETWKRLTKFFGKLFLINFAIGVVTGIVQEFQFGMNWSEYSRFVGDIFGAPLAIEALLAFFLESTFLGIWIFGWDRISPKLHLAAIWIAALGTNISAIWILIANSFMQQPVGFHIQNGRAEMQDFLALITNPHLFLQFPHVITGAFATAGFFVAGISSYQLLRGTDSAAFLRTLKWGLVVGFIATLAVNFTGHEQGRAIAKTQPMKLAAMEARYTDENPAGLPIIGMVDEQTREQKFAITIPYGLSFLVYGSTTGLIKGMNTVEAEYDEKYGPDDYTPPVNVTFWSFRTMVFAGTLMLVISGIGVLLVVLRKANPPRLLLKASLWAIALPWIANTTGWLVAEIGRQPWIVQGLMRTEHGVSVVVSAGEVAFSLAAYTLLYGSLAAVTLFLMGKYTKLGLSATTQE